MKREDARRRPDMLEGLQSVFRQRSGVDVVGIGSSCDDAAHIDGDLRPDVVVAVPPC